MLLKDIIYNVNKNKQFEVKNCINILSDEFNLTINKPQSKLKAYYFASWNLPEDFIGYKVYFLNDKPICMSKKTNSKYKDYFEWLSQEAYNECYLYLLSLSTKKSIRIIDLDKNVADNYSLMYADELQKYHYNNATLNGKSVQIIDKNYKSVKILYDDNNTEWIELNLLKFHYNLK